MKSIINAVKNESSVPSESPERKKFGRRNFLLVSFTSLFTDISTEMMYPLIPGFIRSLGASNVLVGLIEGIAEATAALAKAAFGWLSDRIRHRKLFIFLGYGLSALSKPLMGFAGSWFQVLALRFVERLGKGVRTPARDALIAQSVSKKRRGLGFGFHRAADSIGAATGPLLAMLLLYFSHNNVRLVFYLSIIPALVGLCLVIFIREVKTLSQSVAEARRQGGLNPRFIWFTAVIVIFTLGNSSNAFLLLRAQDSRIALELMPLLWAVYNLVSAITSPLAGWVSDHIGRKQTILASFFVYSGVYFLFGFALSSVSVWFLFAGYGLYLGLSKGVFRAFIADLVPQERRATAYGIFETAIGVALLPASLLFGFLWDSFSAQIAFSVGAALSLIAGVLFLSTQGITRGHHEVH